MPTEGSEALYFALLVAPLIERFIWERYEKARNQEQAIYDREFADIVKQFANGT